MLRRRHVIQEHLGITFTPPPIQKRQATMRKRLMQKELRATRAWQLKRKQKHAGSRSTAKKDPATKEAELGSSGAHQSQGYYRPDETPYLDAPVYVFQFQEEDIHYPDPDELESDAGLGVSCSAKIGDFHGKSVFLMHIIKIGVYFY